MIAENTGHNEERVDAFAWKTVNLFHPSGEHAYAISVPRQSHPKAIVCGHKVYVLEAGRYVEAESWHCAGPRS